MCRCSIGVPCPDAVLLCRCVLFQLVNNAGMAYKGSTFGAEEAANTINCNYHGDSIVTLFVFPQIRISNLPVLSMRRHQTHH